MASVSDVKICNLALVAVGAKRITSLTEDSVEARTCNAMYALVRNDLLCEELWSFAQKRAALAKIDKDPVFTDDGVTVVYKKPSDCLRLTHTNIPALVKIEGDEVLSDADDLQVKYTFEVTNEGIFFPKFITAFAARLAAEMAYPLTSSRSLAKELKAVSDEKLDIAASADSQQGTPTRPLDNQWLQARLATGGPSLFGQSGWDTWYPINAWG